MRVLDDERAQLALRSSPVSPTWPPRLGIERRVVEHDDARRRRPSRRSTARAVDVQRDDLAPSRAQLLVAVEGRRRRRCTRAPGAILNLPAARACSRCSSIAASKPASSTVDAALAADVGGQVEREAVGVVQLEGESSPGRTPLVARGQRGLEDLHAVRDASGRSAPPPAFSTSVDALLVGAQLRVGLAHLAHQVGAPACGRTACSRRACSRGGSRGAMMRRST